MEHRVCVDLQKCWLHKESQQSYTEGSLRVNSARTCRPGQHCCCTDTSCSDAEEDPEYLWARTWGPAQHLSSAHSGLERRYDSSCCCFVSRREVGKDRCIEDGGAAPYQRIW